MAEILYGGKFLNLVREGRWEYCERVKQTRAVMIFALTADNKVLLAEEFRPPIGRRCLCFTAGLVGDEEDETDEAAARRELLEETGYEAAQMRYLFSGPSSPGLTSETLSFFLATGLRRVGEGGGVMTEKITVREVPLAEIDTWLVGLVPVLQRASCSTPASSAVFTSCGRRRREGARYPPQKKSGITPCCAVLATS